MQDCIHKVITALRDDGSMGIRERLLEAALLIEKSCGLDCYFGVSPEEDAAEFTPEDIVELRKGLIEFSEKHREHADVGTAIWALGRFHDEALRGFFIKEMWCHLKARHAHAVSQADCALGNLGDGVDFNCAPGAKLDAEYFQAVRLYLEKRAPELQISKQ